MFDLALSPQLEQLLGSVRAMLTRECPPDASLVTFLGYRCHQSTQDYCGLIIVH